MKHVCLLLCAALLCAAFLLPLSAAALPKNAATAAAMERVGATVGTDTPGAAVLLYEEGTRVMLEPLGYADITARTLVTADTAFEIGALSGIFVSLAVADLAANGFVDPDRDVAEYLPADFVEKLDLTYAVTLRDLLYGTAGFEGRNTDLRFTRPAYCFDTLEEALLAEVPAQVAAPGSFACASPFSIGLAAYVVECVARRPYADFVTDRILKPCGMTSTILDPRQKSEIRNAATGHTQTGEGEFATAAKGGRSYAGIWPADGAISTPADLALLFEYLFAHTSWASLFAPAQSDAVFDFYPLGFSGYAGGSACGLTTSTAYFGAALSLDAASGRLALVLTNTARSDLLQWPGDLFGGTVGKVVDKTEEQNELKTYAGQYLPTTLGRGGLFGRLMAVREGVKVSANKDGTLQFGDRLLRPLGNGAFADADAAEDIAAVVFTLSAEGKVTSILAADGTAYLPASFLEYTFIANALSLLLFAFAVYFLLGGLLALLGAVFSRLREGEKAPWRFAFPWIFAGLLGLFVLLQMLVVKRYGNAAVASFFGAMSVLGLIAAIGAAITFLLAVFTAFTERGRFTRVIRASIIFLLFLLLCGWGKVILI